MKQVRNRINYFPRFRDAILSIGNEILDYDLAIAELSNNIDVENLQQLFSYSESTQRVLLQTYLNRFPDLNLTKAQFDEVRQILKSKSQYRHLLKNGYELIKEYQQFQICKISPQADEKEDELVLYYQNQVTYQACIFIHCFSRQMMVHYQVEVGASAPFSTFCFEVYVCVLRFVCATNELL